MKRIARAAVPFAYGARNAPPAHLSRRLALRYDYRNCQRMPHAHPSKHNAFKTAAFERVLQRPTPALQGRPWMESKR